MVQLDVTMHPVFQEGELEQVQRTLLTTIHEQHSLTEGWGRILYSDRYHVVMGPFPRSMVARVATTISYHSHVLFVEVVLCRP